MSLMLNKLYSKTNLINILFSFIPISFIAGNLILNLNILLFIITTIIFYGRDIINIKLDLLDKIILFLFSFILINGFFNNINNYYYESTSEDLTIAIKTIFYLRFLILYFVLRYLIENDVINFKIFFISCFVCSTFVCLDLIYQLIFGKDIFGLEIVHPRRLSGPFGDEMVAGSYLQRFSIFSFFLFPFFFKIKSKKILYLILLLLFFLVFISIILSGNRMPLLLFLLIIGLIIFLEKKIRKFFIPFLLIFLTIFLGTYYYSFKYDRNIYRHFGDFYLKVLEFKYVFSPSEFEEIQSKKPYKVYPNTYIKEFASGYETWLLNKYIGGGIKSFKVNCKKTDVVNCGPHPHNYYLEILSELGLVGFFIISTIFIIILYRGFIKKLFIKSKEDYNHITTPFLFVFFAEIIPIKTTGSFFTTGNATFLFLMIGIIATLLRKKN